MSSITVSGGSFLTIGDEIEDEISDIKIEMITNIDNELTYTNPFLSGQALANWTVSVDSPDEKFYEGQLERPANQSPKILETEFVTRKDIYITNSVPYIQKLNNGSSDQAPSLFIEMAMLAGVQKVK